MSPSEDNGDQPGAAQWGGSDEATVEQLVARLAKGDGSARGHLFELLYTDLRGRAQRLMASGKSGQTLQPTILVHEAFLKLTGSRAEQSFANGEHFVAVAALAMRQVVIDHLRKKESQRSSPIGRRVTLDGVIEFAPTAEFDLECLLEAIEDLSSFDAPMARAVELRVFGGCTSEEAAKAIDVPLRTFQRRWQSTVEWLRRRVD